MVTVQTGVGVVVGGAVDSVGIGAGEAVGVGEAVGTGATVGTTVLTGAVVGGIVGTVVEDAGNVLDVAGAKALLPAFGFFAWLEDNATAATDAVPMRRTQSVATISPRRGVVARRWLVDRSISGVTSTQPAPFHCLRRDHSAPSQKAWSFGFAPVAYQPGALSFATIKTMLDGRHAQRVMK
jgi:hypothetical protein